MTNFKDLKSKLYHYYSEPVPYEPVKFKISDFQNLQNIEQVYDAFDTLYRYTRQVMCCKEFEMYQDYSTISIKIEQALIVLSQYYNGNTKQVGNWWYYRIGIPNLLLKTLLYVANVPYISSTLRTYNKALNKFLVTNTRTDMTYANLASICRNVFIMSAIYEDENLYKRALNDAVPAFALNNETKRKISQCLQKFYVNHPKLPYCIKMFAGKEGMYQDYTFIQHTAIPYIGTYGLEVLEYAALIASVQEHLDERIVDTLPYWLTAVQNAIYDNQMLLAYCGRAVESVNTEANAALANKYIQQIKDNITYLTSFPVSNPFIQKNADIAQFSGNNGNWKYVVKMSSERTARFEAFNNQNFDGVNQGRGMSYLYIKGDNQYKNLYFSRIKSDELAGVTCCAKSTANNFVSQQPRFDYKPDELKTICAGGLSTVNHHSGACYMQDDEVQKAWVFNDNMICCLGNVKKPNSKYTVIDSRIGSYKIQLLTKENEWRDVKDAENGIYISQEYYKAIYIEGVAAHFIHDDFVKIVHTKEGYCISILHNNTFTKYMYITMPVPDNREQVDKYALLFDTHPTNFEVLDDVLHCWNGEFDFEVNFKKRIAAMNLQYATYNKVMTCYQTLTETVDDTF